MTVMNSTIQANIPLFPSPNNLCYYRLFPINSHIISSVQYYEHQKTHLVQREALSNLKDNKLYYKLINQYRKYYDEYDPYDPENQKNKPYLLVDPNNKTIVSSAHQHGPKQQRKQREPSNQLNSKALSES